jgi:hypothetical protein
MEYYHIFLNFLLLFNISYSSICVINKYFHSRFYISSYDLR